MVLSVVLVPLLLALDAMRVLGALLVMPTALAAPPTRRVSMALPLLVALAKLLRVLLALRTLPPVPVLLTALVALLPQLQAARRLLLLRTTSLLVCTKLLLAMVLVLLLIFLTPSVSPLVEACMVSVFATPMVLSVVLLASPPIARLIAQAEISHPALASRTRLLVLVS